MPRFVSTRYKSLIVADIGVRFVDGVADVADKHVARLRALRSFGVFESGAESRVKTPEAPAPAAEGDELELPAGNASRDVWAKFAAELGIEVAGDAKRADIRAQVEALIADDESDDDDDDDADEADADDADEADADADAN